jgi:hypothetical protein
MSKQMWSDMDPVESERLLKLMDDATKDPEWVQVTFKGRNGQKVKHRVVVHPLEEAEVSVSNQIHHGPPDEVAAGSYHYVAPAPVISRSVKIDLEIRPKGPSNA